MSVNNPLKNSLLAVALLLAALLAPNRADAYAFLHDCAPTWTNLPVRYKINQNGSKHYQDISTIESVFKASFDAWEEPCCSNFRAQYDGLTTLTADRNQGQVVLSFADDSFPREYGGSETIAVTLLSFYQNCTIQQAPILFNGYNHAFRSDGRNVDLQSVATHEVGHLLGLDHSNISRATMYYAYTGGTSARQLHDDDIQGVCALYPRVCSCTQDSQCPGQEQCIDGQCEKVPCTADSQCADDLVCRNGDCVVPPCDSNSDCAPGFQCSNSICVSTCPACRTCTSQSDCGGNGHCIDFNGDGTTRCMVFCSQGGMCPGDSQCFEVPTDRQTLYICLNSDAQTAGLCPSSYACQEPVQNNTSCGGVQCAAGEQCVLGKCEPAPAQPNPDPGTGPGSDSGSGSATPDDEIIVILDEPAGRSSCAVASTHNDAAPTGAPAALLLAAAVAIHRLKRRHTR